MAIPVGRNFCIAPYTQVTLSPAGNYSPCPEIGGQTWIEDSASPIKMWSSEQFKKLRSAFANNEQPTECKRCWDQESYGNQSLRKRLFVGNTSGRKKFKANELADFLDQGHLQGPNQINIMVGNKCNLRCRICGAALSVTFNVEGEHYEKKNNLARSRYTTASKKPIEFNEDQIQELFELTVNVQRLEFYGGEPLLDVPTLTLLRKLVDSGKSKDITLFYNTNGIAAPKSEHFELWKNFKALEFNLSVDDIEHRFTYNRHPGKWSEWLDTLNSLRNFEWQIPISIYAICTVSILNIYYIPEILTKIQELGLPVFLNTVNKPSYYDIVNLPQPAKLEIAAKLRNYTDVSKIQFLINTLETSKSKQSDWLDFKFWTREKDQYRQESFAEVCSEYYGLLKKYDDTI